MEPIETRGITKRYDDTLAVDRIDLRARKGEIVGLLGPNGAGKSTTIKMLVGLVAPTQGRAFIDGHDVHREPLEARARLGYLPEVVSVYGDMTARQFLRYSGRFYDFTDSALTRRVEEMLEDVGIAHAASRKMRTYSKGMRQRAALGAALIHDPEVVILDEPLTGLDPLGVIETREVIMRLGKDKTVLISSHELHAVERLCDRVVILARGKILADQDVRSLTRPGSPRFVLETSAPLEHVQRALKAAPGVAGVDKLPDGRARVTLQPDAEPSAAVAALVNAGVPVAAWTPIEETLEEAFLRVLEANE